MALPEMAVLDVAACCLAQTGGWNLNRERGNMLVWQLLEPTSFFLTTTIVAVDIVAIASTGANAAL